MKFVFLHGAPATGKLTVAKALLTAVSGRLFDNHAAIDVALNVFDFGAPGFWELVHRVRCSVFEAAAQQDVPLLVTTYCYAEPDDRPTLEQFEALLQSHAAEFLPVYLHCSKEEAARRVSNPDRVERRKITTAEGLDRFHSGCVMAPIPRENCLKIDSEAMPADQAAETIVRHFGLARPQD